ncbi:hypothetical protein [Promicromonospora sp. NPDC023805]|uniref:hypothetical protein n=1 Tax=Promicromonospora sp. NPDC023805 TaxID=3154696 RepID=UPI0033E728E3
MGVEYSKLGPLREALAEAARTDESNAERAVERFVELRPGHADTLRARQHHLISGRRGTGKSTLLHVVRVHLRESGAPVAVIDMEKFKNRPFPDVLIEILIKLLDELRPRVRIGRSLHSDLRLRRQFMTTRRELDRMLHDPQAWNKQLTRSRKRGKSSGAKAAGGLRASQHGVGAEVGADATRTAARLDSLTETAAFEEAKIERLQQLASRLSDELTRLVRQSAGDRAAVFIDDFYYVRLTDQPEVLDYLKTVAKGTGIWLKVGGVGERMRPFRDGDPAIGMQPNQDIYPLPIDVTLDDFGTAQRFLEKMLDGVLNPLGLTTAQLFTETARTRMVLACGGAVARDYITLTGSALDAAVERLNKKQAPTGSTLVNIQAEDVNSAASRRMNKKEDEELNLDAGDDAFRLRERWRDICDFVREQGDTAFVLIRQKDLDEGSWGSEIRQLENLRLLHRIRETVPNTPNWRGVKCVVYMVDLGQLTVKRLQKGIPAFWERTSDFDRLRRAEWVYGPDWRAKLQVAPKLTSKETGVSAPESGEPAIAMLFDDPAELDEPHKDAKGATGT